MADLAFDVILNDRGANAGFNKLANSINKSAVAAKKAEDAQLKLGAASLRGKKAALDLSAAEDKLAKVTADSTSTAKDKERAQLAVEKAQLKVAQSNRDTARATEELTTATTKSTKSAGLSREVLVGAGVAAAAGALGLRKIIGASMDFDKAMSGVAAVAGATSGELDLLRTAALNAGRDTSFSASQAAEAEAELAKAGVSTSDILGGALTGALSLAAAGQLDLGDSATIAAQAMNIFKLKGSDVTHIADVLAAGANKSAADVGQLGAAMGQSGLVASQLGISFEDTIAALAAFADNATVGSDAGTSLKTMLLKLAGPSVASAATMKKLGINAFDAAGEFVGLEKFAGILQSRLGKLTTQQRDQALTTIFGTDAIRGANILFSLGAKGVHDYALAVNDSGAAGRNAATQMNNLSGDVEALRGSLETAFIKTGSSANGVLRTMAQKAAEAVNGFSNLPGVVQAVGLSLLAAGTAGAGLLAAFGTFAPKITAARKSLADMGKAGEVANAAIGKIGKGLAIGSGVITGLEAAGFAIRALQDAVVGAAPSVNELTKSLLATKDTAGVMQALGGDLTQFGERVRILSDPSVEQKFSKTMDTIFTLGHAQPKSLRVATDQLSALDKALAGLVESGHQDQAEALFRRLTEAAAKGGASVDELKKTLPEYRDALAGVAVANTLAADSTDKHTTAANGAAAAMGEEKTVAEQLKDKLDALNDANLSAGEADDHFRTTLLDLTETIHQGGKGLDISAAKTDKQRRAVIANREAVFSAIRAAQTHAQAVATQTGSVAAGTAEFGKHIVALRRTLAAAGVLPGAIDAIIAEYGKVPALVTTNVRANTAGAQRALNNINGAIRRIKQQDGTTVTIYVRHETTGPELVVNGQVKARASGGPVEAGHPYVVGENGPELFVPARAGTVMPSNYPSMGRAVTLGSGAVQVVFNGPVGTGAGPEVRQAVEQALNRLSTDLVTGARR